MGACPAVGLIIGTVPIHTHSEGDHDVGCLLNDALKVNSLYLTSSSFYYFSDTAVSPVIDCILTVSDADLLTVTSLMLIVSQS